MFLWRIAEIEVRYIMKRIEIFLLLVLGVCVFISCQMDAGRYVGIVYSEVNTWSENKEFWGHIEYDQIEITNKKSGKKSKIKLSFVTDQFVLGSNYVYALNRGDNISSTKAKIYRYTFDGKNVDEWEMDQISHIYFYDGKIFLQYWVDKEQSYPYTIQNGMIVNAYVEEKDFGKKPKSLKANKARECKVGKNTFYLHSKGFFSTEREYDGYSEPFSSIWNGFEIDSSLSDQEKEKVKALKEKIGYDKDFLYEMLEYQNEGIIYGILVKYSGENKFKKNFAIPLKNVNESFVYKIDIEKDEVTLLERLDDKCAVAAFEDYCIYVEDYSLKKREYKTGIETTLYNLEVDKDELFTINLEDDFLRIVVGEQFYYISR